MGFSCCKALPLGTAALRAGMAAAAVLLVGGSAAGAAGWAPAAGGPVRVQYQPEPYPYRPEPYRQGPYGQDGRQPDRYGRGGYERDPRDGYGQDRRGYDDQQGRYGQGGRGGSFQQSCTEIRQQGSILSAVCGNGRGRQVETSIDVSRCGRSDISNNRGVLQCGNIRGSGREGY